MKIQLLQVNELFDKDSKAMQYFWKQFKKKSLIFVVQLPINIMRILSVQVAAKIPAGLFILTEQR